ncbi:hypothetical protein ACQR1W_01895 [Bradyrhizobium sp. HKCCYLS1011]|uniref:hypothetical protein n=1 Tax=Bradyrhizobium sp. HKCCYLS1011 TaxID=3420733 RepID=UPI003EB82F26
MVFQRATFDPLYIEHLMRLAERSKDRWPYIHRRATDELARIDRELARPESNYAAKENQERRSRPA